MRIGQLAEAAGVSTNAVWYYEQLGLIRCDRCANGYRDYPAAAVRAVLA
jgi:DNA-binding transcriptional MerR regulator